MKNEVFAFELTVKGMDWQSTVNAHSRGQAKSEYHSMISDPWPDIPFISIRCRKVGKARTSEDFVRNAKYRGLPNLKCGHRVSVGVAIGTVVSHNSSANFDVLFDIDSPKHAGLRLNVHPSELVLL